MSRTETSNYQSQAYHHQYYQPNERMSNLSVGDNQSIPVRYTTVGYTNSPIIQRSNTPRATTPLNRYSGESTTIFSEPMRPQSTTFFQNENHQGSRPSSTHYASIGNMRAHSYDDLYRSQCSDYGGSRYPTRSPITRRRVTDELDDLVVKSTDLSAVQERELVELVRSAFQRIDISNQRELAGYLKRSADKRFSSCWHCIVGRQFSSYVTHEINGFIYLTKGPLSILLFKSGA